MTISLYSNGLRKKRKEAALCIAKEGKMLNLTRFNFVCLKKKIQKHQYLFTFINLNHIYFQITLFSNLNIAKLIPRKVRNYFATVHTFQIYIEKLKRAAGNCTIEAGAINSKFFLILKLWIL